MKKAFVFAGQGCQYNKMGASAYEMDSVFREQMTKMDELLWRKFQVRLIENLYGIKAVAGDPVQRLTYSHLAIFCVQYSLAIALKRKGIEPDLVLGYSLGEIVALTVAEALSLEESLFLIFSQATLIEKNVTKGRLVSVFGKMPVILPSAQALGGEIAGINSVENCVIALDCEQYQRYSEDLQRQQIAHFQIAVEYPFHSSRLDPARDEVLGSMALLRFRNPATACFSVTKRAWLPLVDALHVWSIIRETVDFCSAMKVLCSDGVYDFYDLSPNASMSFLLKKNLARVGSHNVFTIMNPFQGGAISL